MTRDNAAGQQKKTTVGTIDDEVLTFTAGKDVELDYALIDADCIGSAAHVSMLSRMDVQPNLFSAEERDAVVGELVQIMHDARQGAFEIMVEDQDVHLAIERRLTERLGDMGKRVHTGRSRNDQVAVALRIYAKEQIMQAIGECISLAQALLQLAERYEMVPMVGRTHFQHAMPSSVGLWAASHAESLMNDAECLRHAAEQNDQCPLGAAASYGVPLPLDREWVADALGFGRLCHTVLFAINARGKNESIILSALNQVMISLSRLSEDLIVFSLPEFAYFSLPKEYCTGSSIMPQKQNPDVLELIRAKSSRVMADMNAVSGIIRSMISGYNRDLQETKEPLMNGINTTRTSMRIMRRMIQGLEVNEAALINSFLPEDYATDKALELVAGGMTFRDAYHYMKAHMDELESMDPHEVIRKKKSTGATGNLGLELLEKRCDDLQQWADQVRTRYQTAWSVLLGVSYPQAFK